MQGINSGRGASMSIQRVPEVPFAQIANSALRDKRLSFKARGVLALVLSNIGEWEASLRWLENQSEKDGKRAIQAALNELTELGYREVRYESRNKKVFTIVEWRHIPCPPQNVTSTKCDGHESGVSIEHYPLEHQSTEQHQKKSAPSAPATNTLAQEITKEYTDRVPLSKFVAVMGIVKRALATNLYTPEQITDALIALADEGRPVTVDTLRIALEGMPVRATRAENRMRDLARDVERITQLEGFGWLPELEQP